jgi:hypothetical protein
VELQLACIAIVQHRRICARLFNDQERSPADFQKDVDRFKMRRSHYGCHPGLVMSRMMDSANGRFDRKCPM